MSLNISPNVIGLQTLAQKIDIEIHNQLPRSGDK